MSSSPKQLDRRFMAAAIRLARHHEGQCGTNPSVACLIVRDDGAGPYIVGSGVTAIGGRPHAEPLALAEAKELAKDATAYVTLEPCAHHGKTPPCAQTLIDAGISRVVTAVSDPDKRVNNLGHQMLGEAGIEVVTGCMANSAGFGLAAYLNHKVNHKPYVTVKLAISPTGHLGIKGQGQVAITGSLAKSQTYLLRASHHAILVGAGTVCEDDPELTCRLSGLKERSPTRIILDPNNRTPLTAKVYQSASETKTIMVASQVSNDRRNALKKLGCDIILCEMVDDEIALPELLDDLGAIGIQSLLVEGGAKTASTFAKEGLIDKLILYQGVTQTRGDNLIASPITDQSVPPEFTLHEKLSLGEDIMSVYIKDKAQG